MKNSNVLIPIASPQLGEEEANAVYYTLKSGWISMGKQVQIFENLCCEYTGAKFGIAMNNGTSTLHAILMALDIGSGDEVILPSLTYISTVNTVLLVGAIPVLCDNDSKTFNVKPDNIKEKITGRTKAFITVDLKGQPVDYDLFCLLSEETGLSFISDSAESFGAIYKGKKVGTQALLHSFSFFANKNITTGEGGIVLTDDIRLANNLRIIRNQGQSERYIHTRLGHNYRMTDIQAALGIEQLKRIEHILNEKVALARHYTEIFSETESIKPPHVPDFVDRPSWYLYSIILDDKIRDKLIDHLNSLNIETRLSFPPIHIQPYHSKELRCESGDYPNALRSFQTFLDIPIWPGMRRSTQDIVTREIKSFVEGRV